MLFYIFAIILVILETTFFNHLQLFSTRPNLVLFLVTIFSFYFNFDKRKIIFFCLFCGLLKDILSISPLGIHMLMFMFLGVALCYISKRFLRYNWVFIIPLFILATIGQGLIHTLLQNVFFSRQLHIFNIAWKTLMLEMLYGFIVFFIFFKPIKRCVIDKLS